MATVPKGLPMPSLRQYEDMIIQRLIKLGVSKKNATYVVKKRVNTALHHERREAAMHVAQQIYPYVYDLIPR